MLYTFSSKDVKRRFDEKSTGLLFILAVFIALACEGKTAAQNPTQVPDRSLERGDSVSALPSRNKRWALLIGVDKYQDRNISPLSGAANDANSLREVLVRYAGFPRDQVVVLSTEEPPERQPTRSNILKRLSNLSGLVPDDGFLLFSFAGHGIERDGQAFLISSDATLTEDLGLLEDTAVSVSQIKKRIKEARIRQVMILLDACRSYPAGRSDSSNPLTVGFTKAFDFSRSNREVTAFAVLYATAVGHRAYEYVEKRQGYFSWGIAQALSGAAANDRGEVTLRALIKYLEHKVPKLVALDYGPKMIQKPFAEIEGYRADEMILALTSSIGGATGTRPAQERPAFTHDNDTKLWDSIKDSKNARELQDYIQKYPNGLFVEVATDRLNQLKVVPAANDADDARAYALSLGARVGKVLVSRTDLRREAQITPVIDDYEFLTPLIQTLKQVSLDITLEWTMDAKSRAQVSGAVWEIKHGGSARAAGYAVNVEVAFSLKDLPQYGELKIAVANITLRAIDSDRGEIVAIHNLDARGFGNEQSQARTNALKEAGQHIPKEFINKVAERAGVIVPRTNAGNDARP